jgi:hypothetical protein
LSLVTVEPTVIISTLDPVPPDDSVMLDGLKELVTPVGVRTESVIVPANPFKLARVTVEVAVAPC